MLFRSGVESPARHLTRNQPSHLLRIRPRNKAMPIAIAIKGPVNSNVFGRCKNSKKTKPHATNSTGPPGALRIASIPGQATHMLRSIKPILPIESDANHRWPSQTTGAKRIDRPTNNSPTPRVSASHRAVLFVGSCGMAIESSSSSFCRSWIDPYLRKQYRSKISTLPAISANAERDSRPVPQ